MKTDCALDVLINMIIYKYLDEEGALKTIEHNSVLLRTPLEFNDPFDSVFNIDKKEMNKAYDLFMNYQLFKKLYKDLIVDRKKPKLLGKITKKNIEYDAPLIKKELVYKSKGYITADYKYGLEVLKHNDANVKEQFSSMMRFAMESLRNVALVSCFGSSPNSILMWSHYANKHKGACVEFEIDDKDFREVVYSKKLLFFRFTDALEILFGHDFANKEVDTNKGEYQFILDPIFVKSIDWSYEGEVRCAYSKTNLDSKIYKIQDEDGEKFLLKMPKIKKIYLGCNADDNFVSQIGKIAGDILVVKMKKCSNEYGLEVEKND